MIDFNISQITRLPANRFGMENSGQYNQIPCPIDWDSITSKFVLEPGWKLVAWCRRPEFQPTIQIRPGLMYEDIDGYYYWFHHHDLDIQNTVEDLLDI